MITREDAIKELERELNMRERVYANLIQRGKMNRSTAERQYLRLKAAITYLKGETTVKPISQKSLFE